MQDTKSNMYSMANKLKNGWVASDSVQKPPAMDSTFMPAPVIPMMEMPMPVIPMMEMPEHVMHMPEMPQPEPVITSTPVITLPAGCAYGKTSVMAFVKMQEWDETYEPAMGMERGTIFPELDLPFIGEGACRHE